NVRDWTVAVSNEWSDRIILASNDGQVICLHHRDRATPLRTKVLEDRKPAAAKPEDKDKEKEKEEKEKEKEKEKGEKEKGKDVGAQAPCRPYGPLARLDAGPRRPAPVPCRGPELTAYAPDTCSRGRSMASPRRALRATASVNSM